jgi:hypothetical protein
MTVDGEGGDCPDGGQCNVICDSRVRKGIRYLLQDALSVQVNKFRLRY